MNYTPAGTTTTQGRVVVHITDGFTMRCGKCGRDANHLIDGRCDGCQGNQP